MRGREPAFCRGQACPREDQLLRDGELDGRDSLTRHGEYDDGIHQGGIGELPIDHELAVPVLGQGLLE